MRTSAIVVGAVVVVGLVVGWLLDRRGRGSPFADRLRFMSHFLLRAYVAAILGWSAVLLARHHDALHLGLATLLGLLMLWSIFMAGVFAWGAGPRRQAAPPRRPSTREQPRSVLRLLGPSAEPPNHVHPSRPEASRLGTFRNTRPPQRLVA